MVPTGGSKNVSLLVKAKSAAPLFQLKLLAIRFEATHAPHSHTAAVATSSTPEAVPPPPLSVVFSFNHLGKTIGRLPLFPELTGAHRCSISQQPKEFRS